MPGKFPIQSYAVVCSGVNVCSYTPHYGNLRRSKAIMKLLKLRLQGVSSDVVKQCAKQMRNPTKIVWRGIAVRVPELPEKSHKFIV